MTWKKVDSNTEHDFTFLLINFAFCQKKKKTVPLNSPNPQQCAPGGNYGINFSNRDYAAWPYRLQAFNLLIHGVAGAPYITKSMQISLLEVGSILKEFH